MRTVRLLCGLVATLAIGSAGAGPALARGAVAADHEWSPAHIDELPQEIRADIAQVGRACAYPLAARHLFSLSIQSKISGERFIALHFDQTNCVDRSAICSEAGCLHRVYFSKGGAYRPMMSEQVLDLTMTFIGGRLWLAIDCSPASTGCAVRRRWNGTRFESAK